MSDIELKARIQILEQELKEAILKSTQKDYELQTFQKEILKLNQKIEGLIARVAMELESAKILQRRIMPTTTPEIPGFEFSPKFLYGTDRGGDYFDIFEMKSKMKFGILLSACSSYTISALLMSALLKLTTFKKDYEGLAAKDFLQELLKDLKGDMKSFDFANLVFALFDRRSYELSLVGYGHFYVFLQRADKDAIEVFQGGSTAEWYEKKISLNSKDRLVFTTPGLIEAVSDTKEKFGIDRAVEAIRTAPRRGAHELKNEILYRLESYTGLQQPVQDVTLIVTEVKDRVIKLAKS